MKKIERREKLRQVSRLNRLVFGVALLWLVTSVLLLVVSGMGSARSNHNKPNNDRTRKDVHHHLYAHIENQVTVRTSFLCWFLGFFWPNVRERMVPFLSPLLRWESAAVVTLGSSQILST